MDTDAVERNVALQAEVQDQLERVRSAKRRNEAAQRSVKDWIETAKVMRKEWPAKRAADGFYFQDTDGNGTDLCHLPI
jgi:hypothetical protein